MIDATLIAPRLYQGAIPPPGPYLRAAGIDAVVLCSKEWQPRAYNYPGVRVVHAPFDDSGWPPTSAEYRSATNAAKIVKRMYQDGLTVLVTCAQGRNRSGLVMALAIHMLSKEPGSDCAALVRRRRENALTNKWFSRALDGLPRRP